MTAGAGTAARGALPPLDEAAGAGVEAAADRRGGVIEEPKAESLCPAEAIAGVEEVATGREAGAGGAAERITGGAARAERVMGAEATGKPEAGAAVESEL